jgi:hypothetical protein
MQSATAPVLKDDPKPRFTVADGVVSDSHTGLTWSAEDVGGKRFTWEQAKAAVAALTLGGFTDWRLPTCDELLTLVDRSRYSPAIDTGAFPSCRSDWYWTSTPAAYSPGGCAWVVGFYGGDADWVSHDGSLLVRAVRASQS